APVHHPQAVPDFLPLVGLARVAGALTLLLVQRVADLPLVYVIVRRLRREQGVVAALALPEGHALLLVEEQLLARLTLERSGGEDGHRLPVCGPGRLLDDDAATRARLPCCRRVHEAVQEGAEILAHG